MKKYFSTPLALLLFLSGMHITIATHFCHGDYAATKISFTGIKASCGMVNNENSGKSSDVVYSSNCCENETKVYAVDQNYSNSVFNNVPENNLTVFYLPQRCVSFSFNSRSFNDASDSGPPIINSANSVRMAEICIFRI